MTLARFAALLLLVLAGCIRMEPISHRPEPTDLPADAEIRRDTASGAVIWLSAENLSARLEQMPEFRALQAAGRFEEIAFAFLDAYRGLFGIVSAREEFTSRPVVRDELEQKHVRLEQSWRGVPVYSAKLIVHLDRENHVTLVQGRYIPTPVNLPVEPALRDADAEQVAARAAIGSENCENCTARLVILPMDGAPRLAYAVEVIRGLTERWLVMVDAQSGSVLRKTSEVRTGTEVPGR